MKKKRLIFIIYAILVLLSQKFVIAQNCMSNNLREAYQYIDKAEAHYKVGGNDSALQHYIKAFTVLGQYLPAFEKSYLAASELAGRMGEYSTCFSLLDSLFTFGFYLDFDDNYFNKDGFTKFRRSSTYSSFTSKKSIYKNNQAIFCDPKTLQYISELYYKDQITRNTILNTLKVFNNEINDTTRKRILDHAINTVDCENRTRLKKFIESKDIAFFKHNTFYMPILGFTIFIHNLEPIEVHSVIDNTDCSYSRKDFYQTIQPMLLELVLLGWLNNKTYAEIIDRTYNRHLNYQIYGVIRDVPILNISRTNKLRTEIGLPLILE